MSMFVVNLFVWTVWSVNLITYSLTSEIGPFLKILKFLNLQGNQKVVMEVEQKTVGETTLQ